MCLQLSQQFIPVLLVVDFHIFIFIAIDATFWFWIWTCRDNPLWFVLQYFFSYLNYACSLVKGPHLSCVHFSNTWLAVLCGQFLCCRIASSPATAFCSNMYESCVVSSMIFVLTYCSAACDLTQLYGFVSGCMFVEGKTQEYWSGIHFHLTLHRKIKIKIFHL